MKQVSISDIFLYLQHPQLINYLKVAIRQLPNTALEYSEKGATQA